MHLGIFLDVPKNRAARGFALDHSEETEDEAQEEAEVNDGGSHGASRVY